MSVKPVIKGVHIVPMGFANAFLIEGNDGLTLVDAGFPGKESVVFEARPALFTEAESILGEPFDKMDNLKCDNLANAVLTSGKISKRR